MKYIGLSSNELSLEGRKVECLIVRVKKIDKEIRKRNEQ